MNDEISFNDIELRTSLYYVERVRQLMKRFQKETGRKLFNVEPKKKSGFLPADMNRDHWMKFLEWMHETRAPELAPASRRQNRAAINHVSEQEFKKNIDEFWPNFMKVETSKKTIRAKYGKRTSARKGKKIDPKVVERLFSVLKSSRSKHSEFIRQMIMASQFWGLRPIEWIDAVWISKSESKKGLLVCNAKATQGRSFGQERTIHLKKDDGALDSKVQKVGIESADFLIRWFSELRKTLLQTHSDADSERLLELYREESERLIHNARQHLSQLYRTHPQLKKIPDSKRITFYSGRHQFAANGKKVGLAPEELAALMGQGSIWTSSQHYGRKANGRGGFEVQADSDNVSAVEAKKTGSDQLKVDPGFLR